jgi:hypothetical protein
MISWRFGLGHYGRVTFGHRWRNGKFRHRCDSILWRFVWRHGIESILWRMFLSWMEPHFRHNLPSVMVANGTVNGICDVWCRFDHRCSYVLVIISCLRHLHLTWCWRQQWHGRWRGGDIIDDVTANGAVTSAMTWQLTSSFWNRHRRQVLIVTWYYLQSSHFEIKWSRFT